MTILVYSLVLPVIFVLLVGFVKAEIHTKDSKGFSHPVDINYAEISLSKRGEYHPPEMLPDEIYLKEGKIDCVTCHILSEDNKEIVTLALKEFDLCLACHIK